MSETSENQLPTKDAPDTPPLASDLPGDQTLATDDADTLAPASDASGAVMAGSDESGDQPTLRPSKTKSRYDFGVVSTATRKSMQGNKRRDTKPEVKVRQMLREMGFTGYRVDWGKAPGRPDVAFVGRKLAIFVMGCFWHRCPVCQMSVPKKNVDYWEAKFARNVERDAQNLEALEAAGWKVLVLWEHQLKKKQLEETRRTLYDFVRHEDDPPYEGANL